MQYLLSEAEYTDLKRKADVFDASGKTQPEAPTPNDWDAWIGGFKADFLKQPTYLGARELMNVEAMTLGALRDADPARSAALKDWIKVELPKKTRDACC